MNLCLERDDHLYRVGNFFHGCSLGKYEKSNSYNIDLIEPMFGTCWSFILSRKKLFRFCKKGKRFCFKIFEKFAKSPKRDFLDFECVPKVLERLIRRVMITLL
ncbi:uncharacterized protein DS421_1g13620 [Arachis hypogaea]|nr:uncharacterized protein DS421_1g13620 [Arachis hypogaea]